MFYRHYPMTMITAAVRVRPALCAAALLVLALSSQATAGTDSAKTVKKGAEQAGMTTAASKANGSGVIVRYRIDGTPQVGTPISIELSFDGVTDPSGATLRLQVEGEVALSSAATTPRILPAGAITTLTIEVTPAAGGAGYLHVFTTQYAALSAISIPIQVGKSSLPHSPDSELKQSTDGEKIRAMQVK